MSLTRTPFRQCGKVYTTREEAWRSKAGQRPEAVVKDCRCGAFHVVKPPKPAPRRRRTKDTGPDAKTRALVLARDGYACVCCGSSVEGQPYSLQHRRARGLGGTSDPMANSPVNLIVLCGLATTPGSCHLACEQRSQEMNARGYWLRSGEDPALVPVMIFSSYRSGVTAWPTADGRWICEEPARGSDAA